MSTRRWPSARTTASASPCRASPGRRVVTATARNIGLGVNKVLAERTVDVLTGNPFGNLESATAGPGRVRVTGWVLDPDVVDPLDIHVYVGSSWGGAGVADIVRPDVAAVFPGYGPVRGFDITVPAAAGLQTIKVYALNKGAGSDNPVIGTRSVFVGGNPFGNVEQVAGQTGAFQLSGWVIDPDTVDPVELHVYVDGGWGGQLLADRPRPDVATAFPMYGGGHGFDIALPAAPGTRQVCVYAINAGSGNDNPLLTCRTVRVT